MLTSQRRIRFAADFFAFVAYEAFDKGDLGWIKVELKLEVAA